jgi:hypothetical protein
MRIQSILIHHRMGHFTRMKRNILLVLAVLMLTLGVFGAVGCRATTHATRVS